MQDYETQTTDTLHRVQDYDTQTTDTLYGVQDYDNVLKNYATQTARRTATLYSSTILFHWGRINSDY